MNILLAYLFFVFIAGGTRLGGVLLRRPSILISISVLMAASYLSIRAIQ
jgi:hypothetical protein